MSSILKVSEAFSLGLHAVVIMAGSADERISVLSIAQIMKASEAHLSKVMQRLAKKGIVRSHRGPGGGFILGRKPAEIKLIDIYNAIEGEFPQEVCLFQNPICGEKGCVLKGFLREINGECKEYFENTNISDLI